MRLRERYGEVVRLPLPGGAAFSVTRPDLLERVLGDPAVFVDERVVPQAEDTRETSPEMSPDVRGLAALTASETLAMLGRWEFAAADGMPLRIDDEMRRLTLGVFGRAMFRLDLYATAPSVAEALPFLLAESERSHLPWSRLTGRLPLERNRRYRHGVRLLGDFVRNMIEDQAGVTLSDEQIRDRILAGLFTAYAMTALPLTWALTALALHPHLRARVEDEACAVFAGHSMPAERLPSAKDVDSLVFTRQVVEETLRLYPPFWLVTRRACEDVELGGHPVPAGSRVVMPLPVVHRHPSFWQDAEAFDPDRFSPERRAGGHRCAYLPFAGAPRTCVDASSAVQATTLVLASIARRFRMDVAPGQRLGWRPRVTLGLRDGVRMTVRRRQ